MKEWLKDHAPEIVGTIIGGAMVICMDIILINAFKWADEKDKQIECYQTYITYNVILKECKVYFEELEEKMERK